ncbi:MAG: hypothetical protein H7Z77_03220 [Chitinophagaceae bacterium]|nr:hypothetical protein [Polaromonas sp.]
MTDDERCCGTGTCLINADGLCWCGQQWDGEKMCFVAQAPLKPPPPPDNGEPGNAPDA